jgi:hypothetical protein
MAADLGSASLIQNDTGETTQYLEKFAQEFNLTFSEISLAKTFFHHENLIPENAKLSDLYEKLKTYQLSKIQVDLLNILTSRYLFKPEEVEEASKIIRGCPWLKELHCNAVIQIMEADREITLLKAFQLICATHGLCYAYNLQLFSENRQTEHEQLVAIIYLVQKLGHIITDKFLGQDMYFIDFCNCTGLLCALIKAGVSSDIALDKVGKFNITPESRDIYVFIWPLILEVMQDENKEVFKGLVVAPWFKFEYLKELQSLLDQHNSFQDAVKILANNYSSIAVSQEEKVVDGLKDQSNSLMVAEEQAQEKRQKHPPIPSAFFILPSVTTTDKKDEADNDSILQGKIDALVKNYGSIFAELKSKIFALVKANVITLQALEANFDKFLQTITSTSADLNQESSQLLEEQSRFLANYSTQRLVQDEKKLEELQKSLATRSWMTGKVLVTLIDLLKLGKMDLTKSLEIIGNVRNQFGENYLSKLRQLSFLVEQLRAEIVTLFDPPEPAVSFFRHADILSGLLCYGYYFEEAKQLINEISKKENAKEILTALGYLLTLNRLNLADKREFIRLLRGNIFPSFKPEHAITVAEKVKKVMEGSMGDYPWYSLMSFIRTMIDNGELILTPVEKSQEKVIQVPEQKLQVEQQEMVPRALTFVGKIAEHQLGAETEKDALNELMDKGKLSYEDIRLASKCFFRETGTEDFRYNAKFFCDHCRQYELRDDQVIIISMLNALCPSEDSNQISNFVRFRPWLTSRHSEILQNLIEVGVMKLQNSLNMLSAVQQSCNEDEEKLKCQLSNLQYLTNQLGARIIQIFPKSRFFEEASYVSGRITLLCDLMSKEYESDLALKIVGEIDEIQMKGKFEFVQSLIQKPDDNAAFRSLVTEPGFKYECLTDLSFSMGCGLSFEDAIHNLKQFAISKDESCGADEEDVAPPDQFKPFS